MREVFIWTGLCTCPEGNSSRFLAPVLRNTGDAKEVQFYHAERKKQEFHILNYIISVALKCPLGNRSPGSHARSHSVIWLRTGFTQINTINRRVKAIYFFIYLLVGIIAVITIAWLASLALALEPTDQRIGVSKTKRPMMASNPFLAVTKFYFQLLRASTYDWACVVFGGFSRSCKPDDDFGIRNCAHTRLRM